MSAEKRRSPRIAARIPLDAEWFSSDRLIHQRVLTESISAHGALLRIMTADPPSSTILLESPTTGQRQAARVIDANEVSGIPGLYELRVELEVPSIEFWGDAELSLRPSGQPPPETD